MFGVKILIFRGKWIDFGTTFFIFQPYEFENLTNTRRVGIRSKIQWVFYRDLDWWPGPQKVQFREITGYPIDCRALLGSVNHLRSIWYHSEPLEILHSPNIYLPARDFFCHFLQQGWSRRLQDRVAVLKTKLLIREWNLKTYHMRWKLS